MSALGQKQTYAQKAMSALARLAAGKADLDRCLVCGIAYQRVRRSNGRGDSTCGRRSRVLTFAPSHKRRWEGDSEREFMGRRTRKPSQGGANQSHLIHFD